MPDVLPTLLRSSQESQQPHNHVSARSAHAVSAGLPPLPLPVCCRGASSTMGKCPGLFAVPSSCSKGSKRNPGPPEACAETLLARQAETSAFATIAE